MEPFFTVVVPSLNQGRFLGQALRSLLAQQADDLEIIVVDGGSTDGSVKIIEKYAERLGGERFGEEGRSSEVLKCGSSEVEKTATASVENLAHERNFRTRFLWYSEPDRGQSHAFNKGFARASGRFLFWLNADDLLLPGTLDRVRAYLAAHGTVEWIAGNQIYIDANGRVLRCSRGNHWHDFLYRHAPVHVYGPSAFFSKALWDRVGGTDEQLRYCMDWDLWLRFKKAGARFERLNHYCWALRQHGGSKTQGGERDKEDVHWREIHAMCRRNGLEVTAAGVWLQRFWRLCAGCYAKSVVDTVKRRGHILKC